MFPPCAWQCMFSETFAEFLYWVYEEFFWQQPGKKIVF
jgi:hypothetical protein